MTKRKAASEVVLESDIECDIEEDIEEDIDEDTEEEIEDGIEDDSDDEDFNPKHESKKAKSSMAVEENPIQKAMQKCHNISISIRDSLLASRHTMLNPTQNLPGVHRFVLKADIEASCEIPERDKNRLQIKPYQISGVNFLLLLHRLRVGGAILADEMGLGKTMQVIAFLAVLKRIEGNVGPHLVVAPVSVLLNWEREIARWCPSFKVVAYHGDKKGGLNKQLSLGDDEPATKFHILITSYSVFEKKSAQMKEDRNFLRKWDWNCVIMDEGHVLKDATSMRSKKLQEIVQKAKQRIMLTGTPVQNDLPELWALLSFLMPEIFDACGKNNLQEFFGARNHSSQDQTLITNIQTLLKPFVMRRTKAESLRHLPSKTQIVKKLTMADDQAQAYREARSKWGKQVELKCASEEANISGTDLLQSQQIIQNAALTNHEVKNSFDYMRKISNHPLLVRRIYKEEGLKKLAKRFYDLTVFGNQCTPKQVYEKLLSSSDFDLHKLCEKHGGIPNSRGKLDDEVILSATKSQALATLLAELKEEGHRCLIFSQWTKILDILECVLSILGYSFVRLDGSTDVQTRQALVDEYNNDEEIFIFLISTRAGGQGLNLVGADTVIIHDVDFNPQLDRQAEDRCHRIGQLKPVTVYRLVTLDSADEVIYNMATDKLNLDATVLQTKLVKDEDDVQIMKQILLKRESSINHDDYIVFIKTF